MKEIHFDYSHEKLHGQETAVLLLARYIYLDGSDSFKAYDAEVSNFFESEIEPHSGADIFLLFLGADDIPFTTIRKANDENERRYFDAEGEVFKIVIDEKEETK